jgi:hypothetical protein
MAWFRVAALTSAWTARWVRQALISGIFISYRCVIIATAHTEDAEMLHGNGPRLRSLRPFPLMAGLPARWYHAEGACGETGSSV